MGDITIRVRSLSKRYAIGQKAHYLALRDVVAHALKAPLRRLWGRSVKRKPVDSQNDQWIWALKDVSFEVKTGEIVGILGRNGAGKTTLLKLLSRITRPTAGFAEVRGRVGSLLEVGTGFHPELTGRENIYLNGAILGMRRIEIDHKFDEIVAFSEVEEFLDTPLKYYSTGMYTRLAFAVAAFLETEILLVDEVLAVGDAAFQKKCLGKMEEVAKEGRTVLFVSHSLAALRGLCGRGLVLDSGRLLFDGQIDEAIAYYSFLIGGAVGSSLLRERRDRQGNGRLRFTGVSFLTASGDRIDTLISGEKVSVILAYEGDSSKPLQNVSLAITFWNFLGQAIFLCWTDLTGQVFDRIAPRGRFIVTIPKLPLQPGRYFLELWCEVNGILADWIEHATTFHVVEGDFFGSGRTLSPEPKHGLVLVEHRFEYEPDGSS